MLCWAPQRPHPHPPRPTPRVWSAPQHIRVVQPNLVYAVGLSLDICHEEALRDQQYFGQFGRTGEQPRPACPPARLRLQRPALHTCPACCAARLGGDCRVQSASNSLTRRQYRLASRSHSLPGGFAAALLIPPLRPGPCCAACSQDLCQPHGARPHAWSRAPRRHRVCICHVQTGRG